jgi:hypothetical protein
VDDLLAIVDDKEAGLLRKCLEDKLGLVKCKMSGKLSYFGMEIGDQKTSINTFDYDE